MSPTVNKNSLASKPVPAFGSCAYNSTLTVRLQTLRGWVAIHSTCMCNRWLLIKNLHTYNGNSNVTWRMQCPLCLWWQTLPLYISQGPVQPHPSNQPVKKTIIKVWLNHFMVWHFIHTTQISKRWSLVWDQWFLNQHFGETVQTSVYVHCWNKVMTDTGISSLCWFLPWCMIFNFR